MSYRIRIFEDNEGRINAGWSNFMDHIQTERYGSLLVNEPMSKWIAYRDEEFAKWGARFDGRDLIFTNKEAATIFLLRWA